MSSSASSLLLRRLRLVLPTTVSARISLHRVVVGQRCSIPFAVEPSTSTTSTATTVVVRFKHGAKRGQHIQRLEEVATSQEHEAAVDRRRKKKEKETARKSGAGRASQMIPTIKDDDGDDNDDEDSGDDDSDDGPGLPDPKDIKDRMLKQIEAFKGYLKGVRGSEPSPEMFDDISVADAYGKGTGLTPLKSVAQVVISSPTMATATCYDPAVAKAVVVAIQNSMKNLNPQKEENGVIRIPLPRPSKELRLETVKSLHKRAEQFRMRLRNVRSKSLKVVKQGVAGQLEGISKDDAFRVQEEVEKIAEDMISRINSLSEEKEKTVMQI